MKTKSAYLCIFVTASAIFMFSCVQTKKIPKGNSFYTFDQNPGLVDVLNTYTLLKSIKGNVTDKTSYVLIKPDSLNQLDDTLIAKKTSILLPKNVNGTDQFLQANREVFFKETDYDTSTSKRSKLVYYDSKLMLQTLTIPIKIRPDPNNSNLPNNFPKQVESAYNIGFATGWKFNRNSYRTSPNLLGLNTNKLSVAPGILFNMGATALNDKNTFPLRGVERKAFTFTTGFVFMVGINNLSIGATLAWDHITGDGKKAWVYQGKRWTGFILALDLLK